MVSLIAALMLFAAPPPVADPGGTAVVFGTVSQSEWCPAGNVRVDLRTGDYAFTARAPREVCNDENLERPVSEGRLGGPKLRALRQAFERAFREGLDRCRDGRELDEVVISNGGPHILVLTDGRSTGAAPTDLSCWTDAAWALHHQLDDTFPSPRR